MTTCLNQSIFKKSKKQKQDTLQKPFFFFFFLVLHSIRYMVVLVAHKNNVKI